MKFTKDDPITQLIWRRFNLPEIDWKIVEALHWNDGKFRFEHPKEPLKPSRKVCSTYRRETVVGLTNAMPSDYQLSEAIQDMARHASEAEPEIQPVVKKGFWQKLRFWS